MKKIILVVLIIITFVKCVGVGEQTEKYDLSKYTDEQIIKLVTTPEIYNYPTDRVSAYEVAHEFIGTANHLVLTEVDGASIKWSVETTKDGDKEVVGVYDDFPQYKIHFPVVVEEDGTVTSHEYRVYMIDDELGDKKEKTLASVLNKINTEKEYIKIVKNMKINTDYFHNTPLSHVFYLIFHNAGSSITEDKMQWEVVIDMNEKDVSIFITDNETTEIYVPARRVANSLVVDLDGVQIDYYYLEDATLGQWVAVYEINKNAKALQSLDNQFNR